MKIVAVTSCATGIAHSYMAAEALRKAGKELGDEIK
jgi:fructose-specific phosphotransferase system component IIB